MSFLGTKSCRKKKIWLKITIFLEILKAVYLSVDWVPKLIQKSFPTWEQKLVQRCKTMVVADACNASYMRAQARFFHQRGRKHFVLVLIEVQTFWSRFFLCGYYFSFSYFAQEKVQKYHKKSQYMFEREEQTVKEV